MICKNACFILFSSYVILRFAYSEDCEYLDCLEKGRWLNDSIDKRIDPCDDFFSFACGTQLQNFKSERQNPKNWGASFSSTFRSNLKKLRDVVKRELVKPQTPEDQRVVRLAKIFWNTCKTTSTEEAVASLTILFKRLGGWPMITQNWNEKSFTWEKFSKCARKLGFSPKMFVHVGLNFDDIAERWSPNDTLQLTIEGTKFVNERHDMIRLHLRKKRILTLVELVAGVDINIEELEEALKFGDALYELNHSIDMPHVELKMKTIKSLKDELPFLDWMSYMRSMLTRHQANYLSDRTCVFADTTYLKSFEALVKKTRKRVQANFAFVALMQELTTFSRPLLLLALANDTAETESICLNTITSVFGPAVDMLIAKLVGPDMKMQLKKVQTNIAQNAKKILEKVPWMDRQTRFHAIRKLDAITFMNAFQDDIFEDPYFDRLEFTQPDAILVMFRELNIFLTDRFYLQAGRPRNKFIIHVSEYETDIILTTSFAAREAQIQPERITNQVFIPGGVLLNNQFSSLPELDFFNYGFIGLQIAVAIGHHMYGKGSYIDCNSLYHSQRSWWTRYTRKLFASNYICQKIGSEFTNDMTELSYIGGAEIAYRTLFESWPQKKVDVTLPGFEYSTKQLFWISSVAWDCDESLKFRYNSMVSHNSNFSADFNCESKAAMNPSKKCRMWIPEE